MAFPSIALQYLIPIPIVMVISFVLFVLRIWTRFRARKMYLDDYLIIIAEVCGIIAGFSVSKLSKVRVTWVTNTGPTSSLC